ncbi:MAG: hypothetical protein R6V30_12115, partial [Paracoccaceae bacterium]
MTSVTLAPLTDAHRAALRAVTVAPGQVIFSGQPSEFVDLPEPLIDVHVILYGGTVAGMFRIDRGFYSHHRFADPDRPGLRTFLVDQAMQGRGIATDTAVQLKPYLRQHYPQARGIFLTVNLRNVGARD